MIRFLDIRRHEAVPQDRETERRHLYLSVFIPAVLVAAFWAVFGLEWAGGWNLNFMGVFPREVNGLLGILTAPLVHGNLEHLAANSVPMLVLGFLLFNAYRKVALPTLAVIWLLTGIGVWIVGRPAWHIGASGVVFGINFFLFFSGLFRLDMRSLALSLLVAFAYGGMIWGIFPLDMQVSFEAHAMGALSGLLMAWYFREVDRAPAVVWDEEDEAENQSPVIVQPANPASPTRKPRIIQLRYTVPPSRGSQQDPSGETPIRKLGGPDS